MAACLIYGIVSSTACTWSPSPQSPRKSSQGFYYTVKPGDNLYRIGKRFGISGDQLARANHVRDVTDLQVGQRLYIPRGTAAGSGRAATDAQLRRAVRDEARRGAKLDFAWPMKSSRLTSRFGRRNGRPHEGIDLAARPGTPIRAAEAGKVIHAGRLGAYGKVVIVKHAGDYRSVYAHARKLYVKKGQFVERAQRVADVGMTGRTTGPHLHFEIRRKDVPKDPLLYLP